ncbi:MAG: hypothetical protein EU533_01990 [Promethearchaeota archaeon]|nr:MAG: hypothetical protein EU533_01990 [Candidatus Lokiarchaeota archaeon]
MIYKIYLIDGDNGISILESTFKKLKENKIDDDLIPGFFKEINKIIDYIQEVMAKGKKENEIIRVIESESATIIIYYYPTLHILFCSISDADDDSDKIIEVMHTIANRFNKKHHSDVKIFRNTNEKISFKTFSADIENLTHNGQIAEVFPIKLIVKNVLEKILNMGMISDFEFHVALLCSGNNSPLKISRMLGKSKMEIAEALKKLKELDIIKI